MQYFTFTAAQNTNTLTTDHIAALEKHVYAEKKCNIPNANQNQWTVINSCPIDHSSVVVQSSQLL